MTIFESFPSSSNAHLYPEFWVTRDQLPESIQSKLPPALEPPLRLEPTPGPDPGLIADARSKVEAAHAAPVGETPLAPFASEPTPVSKSKENTTDIPDHIAPVEAEDQSSTDTVFARAQRLAGKMLEDEQVQNLAAQILAVHKAQQARVARGEFLAQARRQNEEANAERVHYPEGYVDPNRYNMTPYGSNLLPVEARPQAPPPGCTVPYSYQLNTLPPTSPSTPNLAPAGEVTRRGIRAQRAARRGEFDRAVREANQKRTALKAPITPLTRVTDSRQTRIPQLGLPFTPTELRGKPYNPHDKLVEVEKEIKPQTLRERRRAIRVAAKTNRSIERELENAELEKLYEGIDLSDKDAVECLIKSNPMSFNEKRRLRKASVTVRKNLKSMRHQH